jgi:hypothetical protein
MKLRFEFNGEMRVKKAQNSKKIYINIKQSDARVKSKVTFRVVVVE